MSNTGRIINSPENSKYTSIANRILQSKELGFEEKGLLCFLLSLPPDWVIYLNNLPARTGESLKTISRVFKLLVSKGFIESEKEFDGSHRFVGWKHTVHSKPIHPKGNVGTPERDNRDDEKRTSVKAEIRKRVSILNTENTTNPKELQQKESFGTEMVIFESNIQEFKNNSEIKAMVGRFLKIDLPAVEKLMDEFISIQRETKNLGRSLNALGMHFFNWSRKNHKKTAGKSIQRKDF